jgi:hypothetical protein
MALPQLFIRLGGKAQGPFSSDDVREMVRNRKLTPSHEISHDGTHWFFAATIWSELRGEPQSFAATRPATATAPKPTTVTTATPTASRSPSTVTSASITDTSASIPIAETRTSTEPVVRDLPSDSTNPPVVPFDFALTAITIALQVLLVLNVVAYGAFAVFDQNRIVLYQDLVHRALSQSELLAHLRTVQMQSLMMFTWQAVVGLILLVFFCLWIYRIDELIWRRGMEGVRYTPGWCVGWWFIPVANYWKPLQVMAEIWDASMSPARSLQRSEETSPLLVFWWLANVAFAITYDIATVLNYFPTLDHWIAGKWWSIASQCFGGLNAILTLVIVSVVSSRLKAALPRDAVTEAVAAP